MTANRLIYVNGRQTIQSANRQKETMQHLVRQPSCTRESNLVSTRLLRAAQPPISRFPWYVRYLQRNFAGCCQRTGRNCCETLVTNRLKCLDHGPIGRADQRFVPSSES
jgi:hypothetical protein